MAQPILANSSYREPEHNEWLTAIYMIKTILFDADRMVINKPALFSKQLSEQFGIDPKKLLPFFEGEFLLCEVGKADLKQILPKYLKQWGWQKSVEDLLNFWFKNEHYVDERIVNSIKQLQAQGIKCCLSTNQEKYRTAYMKTEMGLAKVFDGFFVSCEIGFMKPSQEFWQTIYAQLRGLQKSEILIWDDEEDTVKAAMRFGFQSKLYKNFEDYQGFTERILNRQ